MTTQHPSIDKRLPWSVGRWTNPPISAVTNEGGALIVTAAEFSDAWRTTYYGFTHDSEHALLAAFPVGAAIEVTFTAELPEQFDQAGIFVSIDHERWIKSGLERSDGRLQLGAVVTRGHSDWSVAPVDDWAGHRVTIRISRTRDALIIRAGLAGQSKQFVRVTPLDPECPTQAGPYLCSPTRKGLSVRFHSWDLTPADNALH
ncbi:DUF1349 domain-containing protein [Nesterenkonia haasae]|uniref:DUF1349 domain-containing protein n=1 Tax=Nesterenkonia haasae TaxID=2587813 RepID=UPI00192EB6F3|nr:DUF1349 domain-containing protein [Nesterenkonia haasae]